ncbi:transcription factor 20 isoform X1 [Osmerus eperlanus]|uniref:transcription factor 20 isoform X1 n=2 Tax=Osmerus eperlanus TaxID=29151 RepID=UPI002E1329AB
MQNFPNSPAPPSLPPGFSGRGAGGPTYQPQPLDPQISPRMPEDYSGMQQQQAPSNPQSHSQHPLHRGHPHPSQAGHMLGFPGRNRGAGDPTQGNLHGGSSSNPYRKEAMDYYLTMGGKDRQRRGGMGYGASFGYSNMDGHIPHQYRHAGSGPASSSGMMSPYPLDYGSTGGSGGSSSGVSGAAGAFSPSHQYNMSQNAALQSVSGSPMQHRQHGQSYHGHQALHHGQQQRAYHHSGHRMTPQYPHYSPQGGASTGSTGMYSPPPHRYHDGANSLPSMNSNSNSVSSSAPANNVGPMENVPQGYHSSSYQGYSPQTHSLHKQPTLQHHNSQHNIGVGGYDSSHKMQHHGPPSSSAYSKHHQASNSSIPHQSSQEVTKSPMHSQTQQSQINQNFSPISNPSPAASAVQSPSCSSSPSPLMSVSEGQGNHPGQTSYPHPPNPRSSHGHGRLLQTVPQLSPTPNSNSSVSSCGSSGSQKAAALNAAVSNRSRMAGPGPRDEASAPVYPASPLSKLQDTSLNSLNALTSQVANLPNTVQHMLLTDTVLSQKRGKDGGASQMQAGPPAPPSGRPRSRNVSAASSTSTVREGSGLGGGDGASEGGVDEESSVLSDRGMPGARMEREEQFSEGEQVRMRQMSGASSGSEPTTYYPSSQGDQVKMRSSEQLSRSSRNPQSVSETKTPMSPSSQSPALQSAESCSNSHRSHSVAMPSHGPPLYSNSVSEPGAADANSKHNYRKTREIKNEGFQEEGAERREKGFKREDEGREQSGERHIDGQDKENRLSSLHNVHSGERDGKHHKTQDCANTDSNFDLEGQQNASGVGVIVSARSESQQPEKPNRPQDNCIEEKPPHTIFRESSSHNGEKGVDLSVYSSHHQLNLKTNFGRLQSNPHAAANKCGYPESLYGGLAVKNRGRPSPGGVMETNSRYQDFHPPQPNYGSLSSKEAGGDSVEAPAKRGGGSGPKGHDDNSQLQQQFPSLLQEVLQGYHLDRRYGRPEQVPPATQSQNVALANFQTRHPYGIAESMRTQSGMGNTPQPSQMATSGKPIQPHQRQVGVVADFGPQGPIPFIKAEAVGTKGLHSAEKSKMAVAHGPHTTDSFPPTPPKHINLADYSLPQRKPLPPSSQPTSSSSAVQELLLQEADPLRAADSQKSSASFLPRSSGRRSVICDVSPVRRSTPESETDKERESHTGSSVIQQSFSSPSRTNVHMTGNSKEEGVEKHEVKMEVSTKEITPEAGHLHPDHHSVLTAKAEIEYHKSLHQSVAMHVDPYRKGKADITVMASRHSQQAPRYPLSNTNPMSPPPRHPAYPHNVDLSSAHASGYSGYRYGDTRERNIMSRNPHFPSHHPYHPLSPTNQLQSPLSANKLTAYPHSRTPHHPHDPMNEWTSALTRPTKDIMMQSASSPGRNKLGQSEQSQRTLSQVEMLANEQRLSKQQVPHQSAYYDMKMWEATHSGRDGAVMMEGDPYHRTQPLPPAAPPCPVSSQVPPGGSNSLELEVSRGVLEDVKPPQPLLASNSVKVSGEVNSVMPQQGPRLTKTGCSGDANPLMLRRRVRSFISPIPAKRQHQDGAQARVVPNSHHSPAALSESSHLNDEDSSSSDITCSRLSSPTPGQNYSQSLSPSGSKKVLPPRKGRGLKLEAIVQKITPNVRKSPHSGGQVDAESNHYGGFSEISQFSDSQDQDYMDDSHSLNEMMPYRGMDETGSLPPSAYSCDPLQTSQGLKHTSGSGALQADFDFGLGATASSVSDKEDLRIATDFSLLGPLPPPPPLPRPVQGSPPPSSSALSDIQHFTNTYQQLETRRGEQSAANLLRQKLQETVMGFDDYPSADYYGSTPPHHSQGQGHLMNRQMCSGRTLLSMTGSPQDKGSDNLVPKGYFPSGKKKGRPVGSVNKQKRVQQAQTQNAIPNAPPIQPATSPAAAAPVPQAIPGTDTTTPPLIVFPPADQKPPPSLTPPTLTQVKVDAESEDIPLETEVKPLRRRRRGVKAEGDVEGLTRTQRRRRRTAVTIPAKEDFETSVGTGSNTGIGGGFSDSRKNVFAPYVHVERKVPEIGAVCTIVNAEEEKKEKGERGASGVKTSSSVIEALLTSALTSQLSRREKEMERLREKKEAEEAETTLQTGKALPLSGYVLSGPVITETNHSGRLLCCLCQKWANYKNLGDLYGPYYPAEYAAKLPKNQPQVRQGPAMTGGSKTGPSLETNSNVLNTQETQVHEEAPVIKSSADIDWSLNYAANPMSPGAMVGTASPAGGEEIMMYLAGQLGTNTSTSNTKARSWDTAPDIRPIPELWKQPEPQTETPTYSQPSKQPPVDDSQQRPQHRKLTSHPRFKRRHKSSDDSPRMVPSNSKASLPFQPPPPALDSLGPLAQLAQLPQMPMDPEELWVHEGCIVWASGVFLVNGRVYGLQEALDGAREACCSFCEMAGSTLGCYSKGCTLRYHYLCAMEADCSLNEENFSLRCPQHKVKSFPRAVDLPSQCTWSSQREAEGYSEEEVVQEG